MIRSLLDGTSPLTLWLIGRQNMPENACVAKKISRVSGADVRDVWERVQSAIKDKLERACESNNDWN